jgi:transposase
MKETELLKALESLQQDYNQLQTKYEQLQQENALLQKALAEAREQGTQAREQVAKQQEDITQILERVNHLEGQGAKDSHNSSKPPSSNGFKEPVRKTQSLREKSGKKSGGQPGHSGRTLMMVEHPDQTLLLTPQECQHCHHDLLGVALGRNERVQVVDLPSLHLHVTEYQVEVKACPCCHLETRAELPAGITTASVQYGPTVKALAVYLSSVHLLPVARVSQILSDLFGTTFSQGSVLAACHHSAEAIAPVLKQIQTALQKSPVIHNDETGFRIDNKRWWLHVAATRLLTLYLAHPKRGQNAMDAMEILPCFRGTSVHDSLSSYLHYDCIHALCVVHYLRELTFISERYAQPWAGEMKTLLLEIKACVEWAREQAMTDLPEEVIAEAESRYRHLVQIGMAANPPPPKRTGKRGSPKKSDALNLLIRLHEYHDLILRFMHDFAVPFDNNLAESDLRMMKLHQKISGCFRTQDGATVFCDLRSYLSTMRKQGVHLLTALRSTMVGSPLLPPLLAAE